MYKNFSLLVFLLLLIGCTASWSRFVTDFEGQELTVSGKLSDTDRINIRINEHTVIRDWIDIVRTGNVEGYFKGEKVLVECHRDSAVNMTRQTICEVFLKNQKIGELFFDVAGLEF